MNQNNGYSYNTKSQRPRYEIATVHHYSSKVNAWPIRNTGMKYSYCHKNETANCLWYLLVPVVRKKEDLPALSFSDPLEYFNGLGSNGTRISVIFASIHTLSLLFLEFQSHEVRIRRIFTFFPSFSFSSFSSSLDSSIKLKLSREVSSLGIKPEIDNYLQREFHLSKFLTSNWFDETGWLSSSQREVDIEFARYCRNYILRWLL